MSFPTGQGRGGFRPAAEVAGRGRADLRPGFEKITPADMATAREVVVPEEFKDAGHFVPPCSPEVQKIYTAIWTELQK